MFNRHDGGKGNKPTPVHDRETYDNNWDKIFNQKKVKEQYPCEVIRPTTNDNEKQQVKKQPLGW